MKCADRKIQREGKLISDCQRLMVIRNEEWLIIGTKFLFQAITLFWKLDIDDSCTTMYLGWRLMNYVLQKFYAICIIYSFLQKKKSCFVWPGLNTHSCGMREVSTYAETQCLQRKLKVMLAERGVGATLAKVTFLDIPFSINETYFSNYKKVLSYSQFHI